LLILIAGVSPTVSRMLWNSFPRPAVDLIVPLSAIALSSLIGVTNDAARYGQAPL
jgi:hypothetical protein